MLGASFFRCLLGESKVMESRELIRHARTHEDFYVENSHLPACGGAQMGTRTGPAASNSYETGNSYKCRRLLMV